MKGTVAIADIHRKPLLRTSSLLRGWGLYIMIYGTLAPGESSTAEESECSGLQHPQSFKHVYMDRPISSIDPGMSLRIPMRSVSLQRSIASYRKKMMDVSLADD